MYRRCVCEKIGTKDAGMTEGEIKLNKSVNTFGGFSPSIIIRFKVLFFSNNAAS